MTLYPKELNKPFFGLVNVMLWNLLRINYVFEESRNFKSGIKRNIPRRRILGVNGFGEDVLTKNRDRYLGDSEWFFVTVLGFKYGAVKIKTSVFYGDVKKYKDFLETPVRKNCMSWYDLIEEDARLFYSEFEDYFDDWHISPVVFVRQMVNDLDKM